MTTQQIQSLVICASNQLKWLMDHGIVCKDLRRYSSIERVRAQFSSNSNATLSAHYRWLLKLHADVINIMPPVESRYKNTRSKLIALLDEAEKAINTDKMRIMISLSGEMRGSCGVFSAGGE